MLGIKLKPCPFCGNKKPIIYISEAGVRVFCDVCKSSTGNFVDRREDEHFYEGALEHVVNVWNERTPSD